MFKFENLQFFSNRFSQKLRVMATNGLRIRFRALKIYIYIYIYICMYVDLIRLYLCDLSIFRGWFGLETGCDLCFLELMYRNLSTFLTWRAASFERLQQVGYADSGPNWGEGVRRGGGYRTLARDGRGG